MSAGRASLKLISKFWNFISSDRRPDCKKTREQNFITAANKVKTISLNAGGVISIDPEEIRDQIITSREQLKHLVHKPGTHSWPSATHGVRFWLYWRNSSKCLGLQLLLSVGSPAERQ